MADEEVHDGLSSISSPSSRHRDLPPRLAHLVRHSPVVTPSPSPASRVRIGKHYVRDRLGKVVFKGSDSFELMRSLQLGIDLSVRRICLQSSVQTDEGRQLRELNMSDFHAKPEFEFDRRRQQEVPPFSFKDYQPLVFAHIRESFGMKSEADYRFSLCRGTDPMSSLGSPGKSGALFFFSGNMKYIIKSVSKGEEKFLFQLLPDYVEFVRRNPDTLLCRFYGMHRITPRGGQNVRFVVFNNFFHTHLRIDRRYDLKGSTVGRNASQEEKRSVGACLKDNDMNTNVYIGRFMRYRLMRQIRIDTEFLEQHRIMDYSMLLGIHNPGEHLVEEGGDDDEESEGETVGEVEREIESDSQSLPAPSLAQLARKRSLQIHKTPLPLRRRPRKPDLVEGDVSSSFVSVSNSTKLDPFLSEFLEEDSNLWLRGERNIFQRFCGGTKASVSIGGYSVSERSTVYFFGIIDILQSYNAKKKLEYFAKGLFSDRRRISCNPPDLYRQRFMNLMERIFPI